MKKKIVALLMVCLFAMSMVGNAKKDDDLNPMQDPSDYTLYARNDFAITGGDVTVIGNAVVKGATSGIGWSKRVENGLLYSASIPEYTGGNQNYRNYVDSLGYVAKTAYNGAVPNFDINLKAFPTLTKKGTLTVSDTVNITESGWYDKIDITNNGSTQFSVTANEGQVIELRVDDFILSNSITINGGGKVIFYVEKFISASVPRINENGNAQNVMLYISGNNDVHFTNVHGRFNLYAPKGTMYFDGSDINIVGNIYTKGNLILNATCDITGFVYIQNADANLNGNSKIYGKLVANNVSIGGSAQVINGNFTTANNGIDTGIVQNITVPVSYAVNTSCTPNGGGTLTPNSTVVTSGTVVTFVAIPNVGYKFIRFEGDIPDADGKIKVTKDISITAVFEKIVTPPTEKPKDFSNFTYAFIYGYDTGIFAADAKLTREEVSAVLYRILKQSEQLDPFERPNSPSYSDVFTNRWSYNAIEYLKSIGVFEDSVMIKPTQSIKRSEVAKMMAMAMHLSPTGNSNITFSDLALDDKNYNYIMALADAGILNGYEDGTIRSETFISRAEFVKMVNVMIGRDARFVIDDITKSPFPDLSESHWAYTEILRGTSAFSLDNETDKFKVDPSKKLDRNKLDME